MRDDQLECKHCMRANSCVDNPSCSAYVEDLDKERTALS